MKLKDIGEFGFIKRMTKDSLPSPSNVLRSVGDDAAVFRLNKDKVILLTTDLLIENIHFLRNTITPEDLGYKAIAVNLSDIAAMGAKPEHAFISIGIPGNTEIEYLDKLYAGMKGLLKKYNVNILGGDTSVSESDLVISITITGSAYPDKILYRNTARPGDKIFSTGFLGNSKAGLHYILNKSEHEDKDSPELIKAHLRPCPYVKEGMFLAGLKGVRAAIDISDGLSSDIGHIAEKSSAGFTLYADTIPVSKALLKFCERFGFDPVDYAVSGGEDYVLVFTADPEYADSIANEYEKKFRARLHLIGEITSSPQRILKSANGDTRVIQSAGWDHLKR